SGGETSNFAEEVMEKGIDKNPGQTLLRLLQGKEPQASTRQPTPPPPPLLSTSYSNLQVITTMRETASGLNSKHEDPSSSPSLGNGSSPSCKSYQSAGAELLRMLQATEPSATQEHHSSAASAVALPWNPRFGAKTPPASSIESSGAELLRMLQTSPPQDAHNGATAGATAGGGSQLDLQVEPPSHFPPPPQTPPMTQGNVAAQHERLLRDILLLGEKSSQMPSSPPITPPASRVEGMSKPIPSVASTEGRGRGRGRGRGQGPGRGRGQGSGRGNV
ncbi:unnamed protein product, partial [Choristocarpus tenellus]